MEFYSNLLCLHFLFISLTPILIWEHYELTKKSGTSYLEVLCAVDHSALHLQSYGRTQRQHMGDGKRLYVRDVSLSLIKAHRAVFYISSHVNYIFRIDFSNCCLGHLTKNKVLSNTCCICFHQLDCD